ncbi:MAG: ABC transporter permease [Coriobacteriales bacterium]|jgi:ABC-2 type transport system permease protein|nr:ABC transporter permease [Coriobacteriales bacterium]
MRQLFATAQKDFFILSSLVTKDFKLKYRRSILGVLWSVLNPLLMMLVLTAVFNFMFKWNVPHYSLYLILGTILFNYVAASTTSGMTSIIDAAPLIKKIRVNKTLFPLEKVVFELLNFSISLVAVVIVVAVTVLDPESTLEITAKVAFLPLLLFYVMLFSAGLSLLLSALAVFFRDVIHLWGVFTLAWTYATPLFYPFDMLDSWMQSAMRFNPMYHYVCYFRNIVLYGYTPDLTLNLQCLAMALVSFALGLFVFSRLQKKFILYV